MRVISQNGHINVPFEIATFALSVSKDCTKIMAYAHGHTFTMARYSNENIAKRAMEKMTNAAASNSYKYTFLNEMEM